MFTRHMRVAVIFKVRYIFAHVKIHFRELECARLKQSPRLIFIFLSYIARKAISKHYNAVEQWRRARASFAESLGLRDALDYHIATYG